MPPKVTITEHDQPSAALVRQATAAVEVTDARGRKISLRKPGVLAQFQLVKALGPETAANTTLVQMYLPTLYVGAIDGEPVHMPRSEMQVDAIVSQLDEDGLVAVMRGVEQHFAAAATKDGMEAVQDEVRK